MIADKLRVAKSTIWVWTKEVAPTDAQKQAFSRNSENGRKAGRRAQKTRRTQDEAARIVRTRTMVDLALEHDSPALWQLIAALLFWCEGGKRDGSSLRFANSDPRLIRTFLHALRKGFAIDESKFRAVMHLHWYHVEKTQKKRWVRATGIPEKQFTKSFLKPNTGIRKRENYQGCLSLRYHDASLAKELTALYHAVATLIGA